MRADLTESWRHFTTEFTSTGMSRPVRNAELRFWLSPYDANGDEYFIDQVVLEQIGNGRDGTPVAQEVETVALVADTDDAVTGGTVSGIIRLTTAEGATIPVDQVELRLADQASDGFNFEEFVETDEEGFFFFEGVPNGEHALTIFSPEGYLAVTDASIRVENQAALEFNYTLKPVVSTVYLPLVTR